MGGVQIFIKEHSYLKHFPVWHCGLEKIGKAGKTWRGSVVLVKVGEEPKRPTLENQLCERRGHLEMEIRRTSWAPKDPTKLATRLQSSKK